MKIRELDKTESSPMELLLLAAPSKTVVDKQLSEGKCCVIENENRNIIGVVVTKHISTSTLEIVNIAVNEKEHNKGLGKMLINYVLAEANKNYYKEIKIGTGNSSIGQLAFYQKCGFRISAIDFDYFLRFYSEAIYENGIKCRDMIILSLMLK